MRDFRRVIFNASSLATIESKLVLVEADVPIVTEDDNGNQYSYGDEGFPTTRPRTSAAEWLGVSPDCEEPPPW
jgi:hypothetical protein